MKSSDILHIRYTVRYRNLLWILRDVVHPQQEDIALRQFREVYDLFPDGRIQYSYYENGSKRAIKKNETHFAAEADFIKLCDEVNTCIANAESSVMFVDDCSGEIRITRPFGRVETMDRGLCSSSANLGSIIINYICGVGGMRG